MPLEPPNLDDRQFDDLFAEAKLRLRQYCPEWTDFNDSDPGIAMVQLFAWLTELMLYRINQVPERNYLTFLKMLNLERAEARPAKTNVVITMSKTAAPRPKTVRRRSRFFVTSDSGDALIFESVEAIDLVPYPLELVQVFDGLNYDDFSEINAGAAKSLRPLGWTPQKGNALYLGYAADPIDQEARFPDRMVLQFFFPDSRPSPIRGGFFDTESSGLPTLVWEYASKLDRDRLEDGKTESSFDADRWRPLTLLEDSTKSLTCEGRVVLRGPGEDCLATPSPKPVDDNLRFWIRCRLADGNYPKELIPEISFVRSNVVEVEHRSTQLNEVVGICDGIQSKFQLQQHPIDAASLELVLMDGGDNIVEKCIKKDDLYSSLPNDLHFTLNANSGEIRFGDGKKGRIPGSAQKLVATAYRAGGGANGNVGAGAITDPPLGVAGIESVTNPREAKGGEDEESLESLKKRAPRILRGDARAVTEDDYRQLAETVPGVGRAIVLSQFLPNHPGLKIPGAVTVVIVPSIPLAPVDGNEAPPKFIPTQGVLSAVARKLDACRPAGTELVVTAPRIRELLLNVVVRPASGVSEYQVREEISKALEYYFRPVELRSSLPDVDPVSHQRRKTLPRWEVGSPIYPSRLYEVLLTAKDSTNDLKLIQSVTKVSLKDSGIEIPVESELSLEPDQLPLVVVSVEISAATGRGRS